MSSERQLTLISPSKTHFGVEGCVWTKSKRQLNVIKAPAMY